MALDFLCANGIECGKKIRIPVDATHYSRRAKTHSPKTGRNPRVLFYKVNPENSSDKIFKIPEGAVSVSFDMEVYKYHIEYGRPKFYDRNDKLLNIGDNK